MGLIERLRADADLRVEITTDETDLVKLVFSGTAGESDTTKALRRNHTPSSAMPMAPQIYPVAS